MLAPFSTNGIELEGGARTELQNWSGGVPVLSAGLLALLGNGASTGVSISKPFVDEIAAEMLAQPPAYLEQLWDDCDHDCGPTSRPSRVRRDKASRRLICRLSGNVRLSSAVTACRPATGSGQAAG